MAGKPRSMLFRILVPVFCVILLLFSLGMGTMSSLYVRWYTDASVRTTNEILGQTASSLDIIHRHLTKVAYSIAHNRVLQAALSEPVGSIQQEWQARHLLSRIFSDEPTTIVDYEITIVGVNGIAAVSGNGGLSVDAGDILQLPAVRRALTGKGITYFSMPGFSYSTRGENVVAGCQPLTRESGEVYGAILISFTEHNLRGFYEDFISPASNITLLGADGTVLSATDSALVGQTSPELLALCERFQSQGSWIHTGDEYIVVARELPYFRAFLVSTTTVDELLQPYHRSRMLLMLVWVGVLLALLLSVSWILRHNLRPLRLMARQMDAGTGRHLPEPIRAASASEIQILTSSYNHMLEELQDYLIRLEAEHQKQKEYELALLQMQINPHFLYNTLDSVKHLVRQNDPQQACGMIDSLISLLRSSLGKSSACITVEEEVQNAWHYIRIMRPRYGNRIAADIAVDPGCLRRKMPGLVLQPFIENAFFHGFQKSVEGSIRVYVNKCHSDPDKLFCEIIDNGDGIPAHLLEHLRTGTLERKSATRIGIQNVRERLEMLYPGECTFQVVSEEGYGVSVQMSFPG